MLRMPRSHIATIEPTTALRFVPTYPYRVSHRVQQQGSGACMGATGQLGHVPVMRKSGVAGPLGFIAAFAAFPRTI